MKKEATEVARNLYSKPRFNSVIFILYVEKHHLFLNIITIEMLIFSDIVTTKWKKIEIEGDRPTKQTKRGTCFRTIEEDEEVEEAISLEGVSEC